MKIQRYDLGWDVMCEKEDGQFVLFSDHEKIVGELAEMLKSVRCTLNPALSSDFFIREKIDNLLKKHDL